MTTTELLAQLAALRQKLEAQDLDEVQRLDLEILEKQIQMQLLVGSFDALKNLDGLGGAELTKLKGLVAEVDQAIDKETERRKLVDRILALAKLALRAAGLRVL